MSQGKINGTLSSSKTDVCIGHRVIQRKSKEAAYLSRFLPSFQKHARVYTDNSKEFIKACQDLQWTHLRNTPHRSETNKITERAVPRVKEGTPTARVQSALPEVWWDRAMECLSYVWNEHDKMADGKTASDKICGVTFDRPLIPFGGKVSYKPISSNNESLLNLLDKRCFPESSWVTSYVREDGQAAETWRTCQPPKLTSQDAITKRSHRKETCRFHVRTGEPSNSLIFLDLSVAKCLLAETLSRMTKKWEKPSSNWKMVSTVGACVVTSFVAATKYIDQNCTSRKKQQSPFPSEYADVMR